MKRPSFTPEPFDSVVISGISPPFERLFRIQRQVAHVLLTRSPLYSPEGFLVRLACVRHAASVRSEPGSNSPIDISRSEGSHAPTGFPDDLPVPPGSIGNCVARARSGPSHILFFFQRAILPESRRKNQNSNARALMSSHVNPKMREKTDKRQKKNRPPPGGSPGRRGFSSFSRFHPGSQPGGHRRGFPPRAAGGTGERRREIYRETPPCSTIAVVVGASPGGGATASSPTTSSRRGFTSPSTSESATLHRHDSLISG